MQSNYRALNAEGRGALGIMLGTLGMAWQLIRIPVLTLLVMLEPVVTFILTGLALLGLLMTLFWKSVGPSDFPMWTMLAISVGLAIALIPYHALIRLLSR